MNPDLLAQLRDIHTPPPVSWWPPAPGWWLLALLVVASLIGLVLWLRRSKRESPRAFCLHRLEQIQRDYERNGDAGACVRGISILLRRYALVAFPREEVAGLTGNAWLEFLDRHGGNGRFMSESGKLLIRGPYEKRLSGDVSGVTQLVRDWLTTHSPQAATSTQGRRDHV